MLQFKRFLTFCLLLSVVIPLFTVDAQSEIPREPLWLAADTASEQGSVPQTEVQTVDSHTLDVTIIFSGVWAQLQTGDGQSYTRLWHDEYSSYREPGQPALPGVTFNILVPQGAQVEVIQHKSSSHSVSLPRQGLPTKIIPAQRQASKSEPPPPWTPPDPVRYASFSLQPQRWYEVKDTFQMRDYTILPLWINPVRYRPANGEIELLERIELRLTWPENSATSLDAALVSDSPSFDRLVSQIVINPPSPVALDTTTQSGEGYLIITPDDFVEELATFVEMKRGQGYIVDLTTLSEIDGYDGISDGDLNDDIFAIQTYIKNFSPQPIYLLLVGDVDFIPSIKSKIKDMNFRTDLYYSTIDDDYKPDILIGRLPARNETDVTNITNKIISYSSGVYNPLYSNTAFISTCDKFINSVREIPNYEISEGSHNYVIDNFTSKLGYPTYFPSFDPQSGGDKLYCVTNEADTDDVKNSISNKRGLITYSGHGLVSGWSDGVIRIYNSDVPSVTPIEFYSLVTSFACFTNALGSGSTFTSFGESWILEPNKAAFSFLGAVYESYWDQDDILEQNFYNSLFQNALFPVPIREAINSGILKVQDKYDGTSKGEAQYYWEIYNLLGDPSQQLWLIPRNLFFLPIIYK